MVCSAAAVLAADPMSTHADNAVVHNADLDELSDSRRWLQR